MFSTGSSTRGATGHSGTKQKTAAGPGKRKNQTNPIEDGILDCENGKMRNEAKSTRRPATKTENPNEPKSQKRAARELPKAIAAPVTAHSRTKRRPSEEPGKRKCETNPISQTSPAI